MAKIRIKTDMVDIKLVDVKPDEFTGAWQWVKDVLETMNACKGDPVKAIEDEMDDTPFDAFCLKGYKIKHKATEVINDFRLKMPITDYDAMMERKKYDITATGLGSEDFEKICNDTIENYKIYSPEEAAKLTGKICARFFYEQGKK